MLSAKVNGTAIATDVLISTNAAPNPIPIFCLYLIYIFPFSVFCFFASGGQRE